MFLKSVLGAALKKGLYGCAAALVAGFHAITTQQPPPDEVGALLWNLAVIPAVTAGVGALSRALGFKAELAGR